VPLCFGLYKCEEMTLLLTAYSGHAVKSFDPLSIEDRLRIFRAAKAIEDAGINQGSFSPRNVVCDENHVYRIIDFHRGTFEAGRRGDSGSGVASWNWTGDTLYPCLTAMILTWTRTKKMLGNRCRRQ